MTYRITKDFHFSASHVLEGLPAGHQCGRLHGHNYIVRLDLSGPDLLPAGFLFDYGDLAPFGAFIDDHLDHRHLNDVVLSPSPTAEALAFHLSRIVRDVLTLPDSVSAAVGVSETPKTWAWWTP